MSDYLKVDFLAPDFSLADVNGKLISLEDFRCRKTVLLCLIRGFA